MTTFASAFRYLSQEGEMLEWLKRHAWKACRRQKCHGGSNPPLSAKKGNESMLGTEIHCLSFVFHNALLIMVRWVLLHSS